jgi:shikimate 5-dehydrogenase
MNCINRELSPRNVIQPRSTGLVIGAGGMARAAVYAMLQMGCNNVFVYNRTTANTTNLADHFNDWASKHTQIHRFRHPVKVLESTNRPWPTGYSLPTMIVSCVTHELLDGNPGADFEMPEPWLESPTGGVVLEMAYMTKETPLIRQVQLFREARQRPWVLVDGIKALIEQSFSQFETMTGKRAPKSRMRNAVYGAIKENTSYLVDGEEFFT